VKQKPKSVSNSLFSQDDLLLRLEEITDMSVFETDRIRSTSFDYMDFNVPESEQDILIHRASNTDFANLCEFYLASLYAQGWREREEYLLPHARSSLCLELNQPDFDAMVTAYSGMLTKTLELPLIQTSEFLGAFKTSDESDTLSCIAQSKSEFVAFYWSTTA
jgi:hypothetical protein